jgi:hypothetical protein
MKDTESGNAFAPSLGIDGEDASFLIADIDSAFGVADPKGKGPTLWTVGDYL